ncbi:SurA N-terminal domain-containing protein [Saccharopolyspora griseoalba]|uniref:SurA N-terminal domain-containing protein n=1 Tax=Saccharopolyspora griseoalba TaxID=1431848 RepID=A0ABW2LJ77_9PSEU
MRTTLSRHGRLLASIAAAGLLLVGCGTGPSQVGAAAIVGDTKIPVSQVKSWFTEVLDKEPRLRSQLEERDGLDDLGRALAGQLVRQELIAEVAEREHLSVDERQVDAMIDRWGGPRATEGEVFTPGNVREFARGEALVTELGRRYFDGLSVTFDYTQATSRSSAQRKAEEMARGGAAATELIERDTAAGTPAGTGQRLRAADSPKLAAATPLFGAEPGTVLAFEPERNAGQWLIVRIQERVAEPSPRAGAADDATLHGLGSQLLGLTADRVGVRLSPRYGAWDPIGLTAAPSEGETTGFRLTAPSSES